MKTIYQLVAQGSLKYLNGKGTLRSKKVFLTKEKAEDYIPDFITMCSSSPENEAKSLGDIDPKHITITIITLELEE